MKVEFGFYQIPSAKYDPTPPDCKIQKWLKHIGDIVRKGEPLLVFEADKVGEVELESPFSGTVVSIKERYHDAADEEGRLWVWNKQNKEFKSPSLILHLPELGYIETGDVSDEPLPKENEGSRNKEPQAEETSRTRAAPAARKLAREHGIDINGVSRTGPFGRVMRADVERAIAERDKPREGVRAETREGILLLAPSREDLTIAHNLERGSGTVIAAGEPVWRDTLDEYDLREIRAIRTEYGKEFQEMFGVPLHVSAPIILAATRALRLKDFWIFNGFWHIEDENNRNNDKVALYTAVNMGISIDLGIPREIDLEKKTITGPRLRIATLHDADDLSFKEFFKQHHDLMSRASSDIRAKKLSQTTLRDWTGWTFIFNNVGAARHRRGNSLFTPNMSAMLNMGVIGKDGKAPLQIFFDHRLIDGVPATLFMDAVYEELTKRVLPEIKLACASVRG